MSEKFTYTRREFFKDVGTIALTIFVAGAYNRFKSREEVNSFETFEDQIIEVEVTDLILNPERYKDKEVYVQGFAFFEDDILNDPMPSFFLCPSEKIYERLKELSPDDRSYLKNPGFITIRTTIEELQKHDNAPFGPYGVIGTVREVDLGGAIKSYFIESRHN